MSDGIEEKEEKSPWVWKAAIVAFPVCLAVFAAIAVGLKVKRGPQTGMEGVTYSATEFSEAILRDSPQTRRRTQLVRGIL